MRSILLMLILSVSAVAQDCPNGRCPLPRRAPAPAAIAVPKVECYWQEGDAETTWRFNVDGHLIGSFDELAGVFTSVDGHRWKFGVPIELEPNNVPIGQLPAGGIDPDRICPDGKGGFSVNGAPVDRQSAFHSLMGNTGAAGIRDDSTLMRVSVIGSDADRQRVMSDLKSNAALKALATSVLVTEFKPESWAVKGLGFVQDGRPTIYIQAPGGGVVHRQDEYDGPEQLAGAIRRAKDYDPKKDADLRKADPKPEPIPVPAPSPGPNSTPTTPSLKIDWLVIGGLIVAFFLFGKKPA